MKRAYKFLLRPATRQTRALHAMLNEYRTLYNAALQERRDAYRHPSRTSIRYGDQSAQLRDIRLTDPDGQGRVKAVSVKREGIRWFVVLSCDDVPADPLPPTGNTAGIDMGVTHFATTSDGEHVSNPRHGELLADELAATQRNLVTFPKRKRARDRTKQHREAARKVAELHAKLRRQRADYHHKAALALVRTYDAIACEDLNIAGMTRAPEPEPDPDQPGAFLPNQAAAKAGLNKSILDAGWGQFLGILADKAESVGRRVIPVDARNTSRTCPDCGHVAAGNRVNQAEFTCQQCGYTANADVVGSMNIAFRAGLVLSDTA